jgi:hypothetical protein
LDSTLIATFRAGKPSRLMAVLGPPAFGFCIGASVKRRGKVRACGPLTSPRGLPRSWVGLRTQPAANRLEIFRSHRMLRCHEAGTIDKGSLAFGIARAQRFAVRVRPSSVRKTSAPSGVIS